MHRLLVVTLLFLQASSTTSQQGRQPPLQQHATTDTIAHMARADSFYISILERTNAQLGLWWNPYGVMIAVLGALFAFLAIVAAVILFRQSNEYRTLLNRSIKEYQSVINAFIEDKNRQIELLKDGVKEAIETNKAELKKATGAEKGKLEKLVERLEQYEKTLRPQETPAAQMPFWQTSFAVPSNLSLGPIQWPSTTNYKIDQFGNVQAVREHTCSKCGTRYVIPPAQFGVVHVGGRPVKCPKCGTTDTVNDWP